MRTQLLNIKTNDAAVVELLYEIVSDTTASGDYAKSMYKLGVALHNIINLPTSDKEIALACSVENADYSGKGFVDVLEKKGKTVRLSVFWNKLFSPNPENGLLVSPVIREYHDKGYDKCDSLVLIDPLLTDATTVKSNLVAILETCNPKYIIIASGLILLSAKDRLLNDLEIQIANKITFCYYGELPEESISKSDLSYLEIFKKLGFPSQELKNKFVPEIVKKRRPAKRHFASPKSKILVIEDDFHWQKLLTNIFSSNGFQVSVARNKEEAFVLVSSEMFQFITLDLSLSSEFHQLDKLDGLTLLEHFKTLKLNDRTPMLVISGYENLFTNFVATSIKTMSKAKFDTLQLLTTVNNEIHMKQQEFSYDISTIE